jgi:hypothetical protein
MMGERDPQKQLCPLRLLGLPRGGFQGSLEAGAPSMPANRCRRRVALRQTVGFLNGRHRASHAETSVAGRLKTSEIPSFLSLVMFSSREE